MILILKLKESAGQLPRSVPDDFHFSLVDSHFLFAN